MTPANNKYICNYGNEHCQYNENCKAIADERCDEACEYLEVEETKASASNSTGLLVAHEEATIALNELAVEYEKLGISGHPKSCRSIVVIMEGLLATARKSIRGN